MACHWSGFFLVEAIFMPTIKYRISTRVHGGQAEVLARFYDGEFSQRAKTRLSVPVAAWNAALGQLEIPKRTTPESVALREQQHRLDELTDAVYTAWWRDRFDAREGWLQQTIDDFFSIPQKSESATMRIRMPDLILEFALIKDISEQTANQYRCLAAALQRYESIARPLYADTFSQKDVEGFVRLFSEETISFKGKPSTAVRSRNTISRTLKRLSSVCNYAVGKGYMAESPFGIGKYKIQGEIYGNPVFLTIAERNRLYEFQGLPARLAVQRDIFIFQCHIGCRVSDLIELTENNVTEDGFLQYIQHKLRRSKPMVVRIPLSDTALEIIAKYKGKCSDNRLLPFAQTTTYNLAIHEILRLAGIDRVVLVQDPKTLQTVPRQIWEVASSHLARRTFIANVFKVTKSERITSAFTGHANGSRAFCRYTSVDDDIKLEVLQNMNEIK